MKVCAKCGSEDVPARDGENECSDCEQGRRRKAAAKRRRERDQVMRDLGLTKVRGALGGTYWE